MEEKKIRIAITHGDTNSTGYETIFKTFADPAILELFTPIIYGSPKIAAYHRKSLDMQANFTIISDAHDAHDDKVNLLTSFDNEVKVELGVATAVSEQAARRALDRALSDFNKGLFDALVTLPATFSTGTAEAPQPLTQTQHIEHTLGLDGKALTIHVHGPVRLASATGDIPLAAALRELSKELVVEKAATLFTSLKRDFRLSNPRIALLQVNPQPGAEEEEILKPAINELRSAGVNAHGPYPADEFFCHYDYLRFDGTLVMYHSQAMTPLSMIAGDNSVQLTAGLPVVVASPTTEPDFEHAGQGVADEATLREAIYLAIDTCRYRQQHDEPLDNPLKKLYHEKRDESEKVRFAIPKKHEQKPQ